MECEKLAQEKTEIQRQYIMVSRFIINISWLSIFKYKYLFQYYEMSYGLNVEMHKQVWYFCLFSGVLLQKVSTSKIDTHCHTFQFWSLFFFPSNSEFQPVILRLSSITGLQSIKLILGWVAGCHHTILCHFPALCWKLLWTLNIFNL